MNYPRWLEEIIRETENISLYEAYEILNEHLPDRVYSREELIAWGMDVDGDLSKESLILYLLVNSNFYMFLSA